MLDPELRSADSSPTRMRLAKAKLAAENSVALSSFLGRGSHSDLRTSSNLSDVASQLPVSSGERSSDAARRSIFSADSAFGNADLSEAQSALKKLLAVRSRSQAEQ